MSFCWKLLLVILLQVRLHTPALEGLALLKPVLKLNSAQAAKGVHMHVSTPLLADHQPSLLLAEGRQLQQIILAAPPPPQCMASKH